MEKRKLSSINQAVIFASGYCTRLKSFTDTNLKLMYHLKENIILNI